MRQVTPDGMAANPLQALPAAEREVAAIIAFAARYYSGLPFEVRLAGPELLHNAAALWARHTQCSQKAIREEGGSHGS